MGWWIFYIKQNKEYSSGFILKKKENIIQKAWLILIYLLVLSVYLFWVSYVFNTVQENF